MTNKIYGYIYMIVNLVNGKRYIGQTTQTIKSRFRGHINESKRNKSNMPIAKAIKKYGVKNFVYGEICTAYNQEELNVLEGVHINKYNTLDRKTGYNLKGVDINGKPKLHETTKAKLSKVKSQSKYQDIARTNGKTTRGKSISNSLSKYAGVCPARNNWKAYININGKIIHLGNYKNEIAAAQAYDITELKHMGDQALLNFPDLKQQYLNGEIQPEKLIANKTVRTNKKSDSKVVGVTYHKARKIWRVNLTGFKEKCFKTKADAEAYALECLKIREQNKAA